MDWTTYTRTTPIESLKKRASNIRTHCHENTVTYCQNVFIPLTNICKDRCTYCTFQRRPEDPGAEIMTPGQVLDRVKQAKALGCTEVLVSLGDKSDYFPEVRSWLNERGYRNMIEYTTAICKMIIEETGLLPHTNAGVLTKHQLAGLKPYNASMGMMLENVSPRLTEPGEVHEHAPDKKPHRRIRMIEEAGRLQIPFTTGLLVGIGETWEERIDTLLAIRDLHNTYGHIQEVIIQNFQPKEGMSSLEDGVVSEEDMLRLAAVAQVMFQGKIHVQVPPNLNRRYLKELLASGITDWGGVSPLTIDYINPEAPWPARDRLIETTESLGLKAEERLAIYDHYIHKPGFLEGPAHEAVHELKKERSQFV
ncbi:FO synthase subunit 1 [Salsuginibacillus halophilus]|uniref:7,8-didemethyl-8-hydroxy-5-deazariboflavin synthase n=1 Tax=Salsuginibacillus halophilus TaxID=517424 RepID=A0A2P8HQK6_9BACI|nr:7,8-didemethyl-8-hydroxy-5-deazariboflavin synthase CofG [Salsuginibacillus halophilus]PSL48503.1 FO synthase subunit 1 [Salsuginibacillus halophilus]